MNLSCNITINGVVNASDIPSANGTDTNYTVSGFNDDVYYWNISCSDDSSNFNTSSTRVFQVDTRAPSWSLNKTSTGNLVNYSPDRVYQFNIT